MAIDRSRFKATPISVIQQQDEEVDSVTGKGRNTDYHAIKEGDNTFRICPAHGTSTSYTVPRTTSWLPQDRKDKDTGVVERKKLPIYNSRIHGGTPKDIVEEYFKFVRSMLSAEIQDKKAFDKRMAPLTGYRQPDGKWVFGIGSMTGWMMYAWKLVGDTKKLAFLEIQSVVRDQMNELAASTDESNQAIAVDPFTDPDDGIPIIINYNPREQKNADKYKVRFLTKAIDKFTTTRLPLALTDEELEEQEKLPSLADIYVNCYKRSDFQKAINGLKIIDTEHKYNAFAHDDFLSIVEEISDYYPVENEAEVEESEPSQEQPPRRSNPPQNTSPINERKTPAGSIRRGESTRDNATEQFPPLKSETPALENDEFGISEMNREELKAFLKINKIGFLVKPTTSDKEIREAIMQYLLENQEEEETPSTTEDLPWEKNAENAGSGAASLQKRFGK